MSNQIFHYSETGISSGQRFYLKDDVSGIFLRNLNIDSNFPVVASNLVYNTGNQTISGTKTFDVFPIVSGNRLITGVDLSSYATTSNLALTGLNLSNSIDSLSGSLNSSGINLTNSINSLSGLFTGYTGDLDSTFVTDIQLQNTGSTLSQNINSLSGTLTNDYYLKSNPSGFITGVDLSSYLTSSTASSTYATITNLASTGSTLVTNLANTGSTLVSSINSFSGLFTGFTGNLDATYATDIQLFNTGSTLDNKINSLSGVSVLTYGNQNISGTKNFIDNVNFSGTGTFNAIDLNNIDNLSLSGVDVTLTDSIINVNRNIFISGNPVLTGVNLTPYATTVNLALTGLNLSNNISSLSGLFTGYTGNLDSTFASDTQLFNTGSTLDAKINALSGSSVLLYDNQTISGFKTFATGVNISGKVGIGIDSNNNFGLYVRKSPAGVSVNPDSNSIAVFEGSGNSHITVLGSDAQSAGVVLGSPADNFGSYLTWNHDNNELKLATASPGGYIQLLTNTETQAVRITSAGNVGIGTISPSEKLQVVGNILANNLVYNTGNQSISGNKTFINNINVSGTGIFNAVDLNNIDELSLSGVNVTITSGIVALTNRPTVNGTGVVLSGELDSTGILLSNRISSLSGSLNSSGNNLNNSIISLSGLFTGFTGNLDATFATDTQVANTGITLNTRINNLSGYINSTSSNIVFTTGNQTISGVKTFVQDATFGDTGQGDFLVISGNNFTVYGSGNFTSGLFVNGNAVLTGVNLTPYATTANLASTGSTLNNSIISLSGLFTGYTGALDTTFASDIQLFNTGSTLNTKIDNLSGVSVLRFGDQTISGIKTFIGNHNISGNLNVTGNSSIRGSLDVTGLVVSGLGTPFILKSASDNNNSVYFDPLAAGQQGLLHSDFTRTNVLYGPTGDLDLSIIYNTIKTTKVLKFQTPDGGFGVLNRAILDSNGNFGIGSGISSVPSRFYVSGNSILQGDVTVSGNTTITGHLSAASKSFLIDHPTQIGKKLQYGSLESPYHGIRLTDKNKISAETVKVYLPEYISSLVNEDKVNIQLTNINHDKVLFVKEVDINENNFTVGMNRGWFDKNEYEFYWSFTAERKDIPKLTVEF